MCFDINSAYGSISIHCWCFDIIFKKLVDLALAVFLKGTEPWLNGLDISPNHTQQTRTRLET